MIGKGSLPSLRAIRPANVSQGELFLGYHLSKAGERNAVIAWLKDNAGPSGCRTLLTLLWPLPAVGQEMTASKGSHGTGRGSDGNRGGRTP